MANALDVAAAPGYEIHGLAFHGAAGQFEHQSLVPGTRYFYRLCAVDRAGNVSTGAVRSAVAR